MSVPAPAPLRLSVIVPSWNDRDNLGRLIPALARLNEFHEVIVVDASPDPVAEEIVRAGGGIHCRTEIPNRGAQMNLGAERATGDVLIFHHADSILSAAHVAAIDRALRDSEVIGGAFYRKFDRRHPRLLRLETVARFLTRRGGSFFGDQSVFVRRDTFRALGGFAPIPLMETWSFPGVCDAPAKWPCLTPRWNPPPGDMRPGARGAPRSRTGSFIVPYKCRLSPHNLHCWYYSQQWFAPNESVLFKPSIEEMCRRCGCGRRWGRPQLDSKTSTPGPQPFDEFSRRCGREQCLPRAFVIKRSREGANTDEVVVHHLLWHSDDENQVDQLLARIEAHPFRAPSDPEHDLIDKISPRMREGDTAIRHRRAFSFAFHDRIEKLLRSPQFTALVEELHNFPNRFTGRPAAQFEHDMSRIEQGVE